jgi:hypothetical protein
MTKAPVVWIATPRREAAKPGTVKIEDLLDGLDDHYADPIRELAELGKSGKSPWNLWTVVVGGGGIYQARNTIVTEFMEATTEDHDRLFFVDYDLMPTAQNYVDILCHDLSIVGGLYTTRQDNGHWVINRLPGARPNERGILPVMELGTGFKCFKRSVFKKVLADNPWLDCVNEVTKGKRFYSFFSMGPVWDKKQWPGIGRGLTEDYWFDWLCRESGFVTCVDTKIQLRHKDDHTARVYPAIFPQNPGVLPLEAVEP